MDDNAGIEAVHRQFDDALDGYPRNDLAAPELKTRELAASNKVVHEIVREAEEFCCFGDG